MTVNGVRGGVPGPPEDLRVRIAEAPCECSAPRLAGSGIRGWEHIEALAGSTDGLLIGSALLECMDEGRDPGDWLARLR